MSADDLLARLDELSAELKVQDRPERRAWNFLQPTRGGWTAQPYDDRAFDLWRRVLGRFPDDLRAVHHLAIMHHARAIDAEQSNRPGQSDPDWRQALVYWHRLFYADEFWTELSGRVDATPDPVPRVRANFAERLLRMHFDIALDAHSPHHRARFHVRLALDSPFPREVVDSVRLTAYERAIAAVDASAWRPDTVDPALLQPAIDAVTHYLHLDEECGAALNDLLRLLRQLGAWQIQRANASTDPTERDSALDEIRTCARGYDGHLARWEKLLLNAAEPDELALADLALWYYRAAQASNARKADDEAIGYYKRAIKAARAGSDPRLEDYRAEWLVSMMLFARRRLWDGEADRAKRLLDSADGQQNLPALAMMLRADVWLGLDELDKSEREIRNAERALKSQPDPPAFFRSGSPEFVRGECRRLRADIVERRLEQRLEPHLKKGNDAIAAGRMGEARLAYDNVLRLLHDAKQGNGDALDATTANYLARVRRIQARLQERW